MSKLESCLLDCEYFPTIQWFEIFLNSDIVVLERYEYFERKSYRNRCIVAGPNGAITLSVPLAGGRNQKSIMKDVRIAYNENWQAQHWKTIKTCYNSTPYFEYFEPEIFNFFQTKFEFLVEMNVASIELVLRLGKIKKEFRFTEFYSKEVSCEDYRKSFSPENTENQKSSLSYIQPFADRFGFIPNLSILDMLFCERLQALI